ncbi:hypothetical protein IG631_17139 [Alternaria alternata]|nr:hypothetical protein IG631_17139 [Alternaria alternata]
MFESVPSLSLTTKRPTIQPRWQSDGSSKMHIPLTTLGDNDKLPSSSSHELPYTHTKKQSIFGRLGRAAKRYLGPRFAGWRFSVLSFAVWAAIVLLINIAATIAGFTVPSDEKGVFFEGDCVYVKRLNTGLHLAINILSTIILAGSNYTMQCLSAPTRNEIDAAHSRKPAVHLDVGILSIRNLSYISERRTFLWLLLGLSSLPLHLVYNSAVYGSISTNSYYVFSVDETFITDEQCTHCANPLPTPVARTLRQPTNDYDTSEVTSTLINLWSKANARSLEELTPSRCIEEYATSIQSNRRNLLLVSDDDRLPSPTNHYFMNGSHVYWADKFETQDWFTSSKRSLKFEWMCQNLNDKSPPCSAMVENIRNNLENEPWKVGQICYNDDQNCSSSDAPVKRCLSEPAEPRCKIHFEPGIAIVVIVLNLFSLVKAGLMFYIAFRVNDEPLMAMGDAVASFLDKEDVETKNMCLSSMADFRNGKGYKVGPRQYSGGAYHWKDVTSKLRRCITLIMWVMLSILLLFTHNADQVFAGFSCR